jgi:hypothetical protein
MDWVDWSVMVVRVVLVFFVLLIAVLLYIWMERKVIADMQTRVGPMRAGPRAACSSRWPTASSCSSRKASPPRTPTGPST